MHKALRIYCTTGTPVALFHVLTSEDIDDVISHCCMVETGKQVLSIK